MTTTTAAAWICITTPIWGGVLCALVYIGLSKYFAWKERRMMEVKRRILNNKLSVIDGL